MLSIRLAGLILISIAAGLSSCTLFTPAVPAPDHPKKAPAEMPKIPAPDAAAVDVRPGYKVDVVVTDLSYPSSVEFDEQNNLYVAEAGHVYGDESAPARVLRISPAGAIDVIADQLSGPVTDLLWHHSKLYISQRGKISVLDGDHRVRDLVTGLPSLGDHYNNQLTAGPDGKIYFGQGVATNAGVVGIDNFLFLWLPKYPDFHDVPARDIQVTGKFTTINPMMLGTPDASKVVATAAFSAFGTGSPKDGLVKGAVKSNGTILRMNEDGSNLEVYAWGLRNPFGVLWAPDGQLYVAENSFDERGSRPIANGPDFVWRIKEGAWYGFPDYAGGVPVTDPRFKPKHGAAPTFLMEKHPPVEQPFLTRPVHAAVTKLEASPGGNFGYEGDLFMAEFGDVTPVTGTLKDGRHVGSQVVRISPKSGQVEVFFKAKDSALGEKGWEYVATPGPRRPIDVRFSPDGALYIVDLGAFAALETTVPLPQPFEGTGVIWRIVREGEPAPAIPSGLSVKPKGRVQAGK